MLIARNEHHEGWYITTSCQPNKALVEKTGEETPCIGRAVLQLMDPQKFEGGWKSVDLHSIPVDGYREFCGWPEAHKVLINEAKLLIESLKR
jgi:hypothetical protein